MRVRAISLAGNGSWTRVLDLYVAESERPRPQLCPSRDSACLTKPSDPAGYHNVLFAMIFVPFAIILLVCLLVTMLLLLNKKR